MGGCRYSHPVGLGGTQEFVVSYPVTLRAHFIAVEGKGATERLPEIGWGTDTLRSGRQPLHGCKAFLQLCLKYSPKQVVG